MATTQSPIGPALRKAGETDERLSASRHSRLSELPGSLKGWLAEPRVTEQLTVVGEYRSF